MVPARREACSEGEALRLRLARAEASVQQLQVTLAEVTSL